MRHPVSVLFSSFICMYTFFIENFSNDSDLTSSNDMHHLKSIIVKKRLAIIGHSSSKIFSKLWKSSSYVFHFVHENCVFHPKLSWGDQKTIQFTSFLLRHFIALAQLQTKQKSQKFRLHRNSH